MRCFLTFHIRLDLCFIFYTACVRGLIYGCAGIYYYCTAGATRVVARRLKDPIEGDDRR